MLQLLNSANVSRYKKSDQIRESQIFHGLYGWVGSVGIYGLNITIILCPTLLEQDYFPWGKLVGNPKRVAKAIKSCIDTSTHQIVLRKNIKLCRYTIQKCRFPPILQPPYIKLLFWKYIFLVINLDFIKYLICARVHSLIIMYSCKTIWMILIKLFIYYFNSLNGQLQANIYVTLLTHTHSHIFVFLSVST